MAESARSPIRCVNRAGSRVGVGIGAAARAAAAGRQEPTIIRRKAHRIGWVTDAAFGLDRDHRGMDESAEPA